MRDRTWTHKSIRKRCTALRRQRLPCGHGLLARLRHDQTFSVRTNRKRLAGTHDPQRDRPFRYRARGRRWYRSRSLPVRSVDSKQQEVVGNFTNPGRCWRQHDRDVLAHDFPSWAVGPGIRYGSYDVGRNAGYVVIGTSHETSAFAVAAIRRWGLAVGRHYYAGPKRRLLQAAGGGAQSSRRWAWKVERQRLADEFGLIITVRHYPPGASKWNGIAHRRCCLSSSNGAGEPLVSYEAMLKFIRRTRAATGFPCQARLDITKYPRRVQITKEQKATVRLERRPILPQWNYTIWPHKT